MEKPTAEWICETLGEWFDSPCNYGFGEIEVAEFMIDNAGGWCEDRCAACSPEECWLRFFETLKQWQTEKKNTINT